MTLGRERELLAQLTDLLLPPPPAPSSTPISRRSNDGGGAWPPSDEILVAGTGSVVHDCLVKAEYSGGLPDTGRVSSSMDTAAACGGTRRRRRGSKRARREDRAGDDEEQDEPAGANAQPAHCRKISRKKKQQSASLLVTSVPDFDGYQWRKYGQKQIEGAMYPRSYYRCTRSAEQGCAAKRTVQRNDDDDDGDGGGGAPKYTVAYTAEHTCRDDDESLEAAPVILETTATAVVPAAASADKSEHGRVSAAAVSMAARRDAVDDDPAGGLGPATISAGDESPAISDVTWSWSGGGACEHAVVVDDDYSGLLFAGVDDGWDPTAAAADASTTTTLLQEIGDCFVGPIRSPVHVGVAADGWTIDDQYLQLVNNALMNNLFSSPDFSF
ncbi:hypothetical protein ACP4OV_003346 [Aristida adscensionis]